jgi:hypothetical protein
MLWLVILITFPIGVLIGWALRYKQENNRCIDGLEHSWEHISTIVDCETEYEEPCSYHMGGYYRYPVYIDEYRCRKCGKLKQIKK